jgi:hypothetical protein
MLPVIWLAGLALGAIGAGVILTSYWKELISWIQRTIEKIEKIQQVIEGVLVLAGAKTFIVLMQDGVKNIVKYYLKNKITNEYEERVTKKKVNEKDVPEELRAKLHMGVENDTSRELLAKLTA